MGFVNLVSNGCAAVAAFFNWKSLPERRRIAAEKALAKEEAAKSSGAGAVSDAVYQGRTDDVNRHISDVLRLVFLVCVFGACGCGVCGCVRTVTQYVPADRAVSAETRDGVAGWFVPNATMNDLLKAAQRAKDLEREKAVTARMDGKQ